MNVVIKMMDADNTGFRLLTVTEPVDVHVKAYNPPAFQKPVLVVGYGLTALNKTYDVNGNVYIMNEAGDTISKVDYADVSKGMPAESKQPTETMVGTGLTLNIKPVRELGPVHIDDDENRDFGVLLKKWAKEGDQIGGYFDGNFKTLESITSIMVRQYKAYAKPDIIEEIRKAEEWPALKIEMLVANEKLVNPPLVEVAVSETSVEVKSNGDLQINSSGPLIVDATVQYARYEADVPERDANGQVVFDGQGNTVIKHKKGDIILNELMKPMLAEKPPYLG